MLSSVGYISNEQGLLADRTILSYREMDFNLLLDHFINLRLMYSTTAWMEDNTIQTGMLLKQSPETRVRLAIPGVTTCNTLVCSRDTQGVQFSKRQRYLPLIYLHSKDFVMHSTYKENSIYESMYTMVSDYLLVEGINTIDHFRYQLLVNYLLSYKRGLYTPCLEKDLVTQFLSQLNLLSTKQYSTYIVTIPERVMNKLRLNQEFNSVLFPIDLEHQRNLYRYNNFLLSMVPDFVLQLHYIEVLKYRKGKPNECYHPLNIHWIVTPIDDIYAPTVQIPPSPIEQQGEVDFIYRLNHCIYMLDTALQNSFVAYSK